jgi:hypothetical protein
MTKFRSALRSFALISVASLALAAPLAAHEDDDALDIAGMTLGMGPQTPAKEEAVSTAGPTIAEAALPLDPRFSPARIQADVTFFADDLLLGRDTGSQGHEIAARYVASRFTGLGLTPMGDQSANGRSWLQRITFQKTTRAEGPRAWTSRAPMARRSPSPRARTRWSASRSPRASWTSRPRWSSSAMGLRTRNTASTITRGWM